MDDLPEDMRVKVQARMDESARRNKVVTQTYVYNLDDEGVLKQAQAGVYLELDQITTFQVQENPSGGYTWLWDQDACDESVVTIEDNTGPVDKRVNSQGEHVRHQMVGMPENRYITVTGVGEGSCVFRMVYARVWEFDWSNLQDKKYLRMIQMPIHVFGELPGLK